MHTNLARLRHGAGLPPRKAAAWKAAYIRAKRENGIADAFDIVDACIDADVLDALVDSLLLAKMPALIVVPNPGFHDGDPCEIIGRAPTNALPFALAQRLSEDLGCDFDRDIVQVERPGRTDLEKFPRFLWQPRFEGAVRRDRAYIIVDDVCTNGGTLAMLRSHIVGNGGTVVAATTLAHKSGDSQPFPIERGTYDVLSSFYGVGLSVFWKQEIGHEIGCLTEGEGTGLVEWTRKYVPAGDHPLALQRLRDRFAEAKGTAG